VFSVGNRLRETFFVDSTKVSKIDLVPCGILADTFPVAEKPAPVSPTFTGKVPHLEIDLRNCELGDPCREEIKAVAETPQSPEIHWRPAYVCRIHRVWEFFKKIGWVNG
jgi:hypothetical protein